MPKNGWNEYKKLIIHQLEDTNLQLKYISTSITEMQKDIAGLKVKAAIVGGMAGIVATGVASMVLTAFK